jgi:purine-binding chemotaxis protein CheW
MPETKLVVFRIAGEDYAADIHDVQEVIRSPDITPLPHPTPPVVGVFNLRGRIVTAVDGNAALGFGPGGAPVSRTVILQAPGRTIGLLVEAANQVLTVDDESVRPASEAQEAPTSKGVVIHDGKPIVLLDIPFLLGRESAAATDARQPE